MKINVDLEDLYCCSACGVVFDKSKVKRTVTQYKETYYKCPLCKSDVIDYERN